jgi:hypothetical protein
MAGNRQYLNPISRFRENDNPMVGLRNSKIIDRAPFVRSWPGCLEKLKAPSGVSTSLVNETLDSVYGVPASAGRMNAVSNALEVSTIACFWTVRRLKLGLHAGKAPLQPHPKPKCSVTNSRFCFWGGYMIRSVP